MTTSSAQTYYIYENVNRSVIHRGSCGYCNEGKGISLGMYHADHGTWHGAFATEENAVAFARSLPRGLVPRRCRRCLG